MCVYLLRYTLLYNLILKFPHYPKVPLSERASGPKRFDNREPTVCLQLSNI